MLILLNRDHYFAKDFEISLLGSEFDRIVFEERNNDPLEIISFSNFITVTVFMVGAPIFLEINMTATKILL